MVSTVNILADPFLTFVQGTSILIFDVNLGVRADSEDDSPVGRNRSEDLGNRQSVTGHRVRRPDTGLLNFNLKNSVAHLDGINSDFVPGFKPSLARIDIGNQCITDAVTVSIPVDMRRTSLKQVTVLGISDYSPLFRSELFDVLNKLTLYLVIGAVNIGEINVRKMQGKFVEEGGVFEFHDIVVLVCNTNITQ
jgi:hypothetical protein